MPTNITDVDVWTTTIITAADGDPVNQASRETEAQGLSDRTRYLYNKLPGAQATLLSVPITSAAEFNEGGSKAWDYGIVNSEGWYQIITSATQLMYMAIPHFPGCKLTEVHAQLHGDLGAGSHGGLPASLPQMNLSRLGVLGTYGAPIATVTDLSGSLPVYETQHTISITGQSENFIHDQPLRIDFRGESGGSSQPATMCWNGLYIKVEPV